MRKELGICLQFVPHISCINETQIHLTIELIERPFICVIPLKIWESIVFSSIWVFEWIFLKAFTVFVGIWPKMSVLVICGIQSIMSYNRDMSENLRDMSWPGLYMVSASTQPELCLKGWPFVKTRLKWFISEIGIQCIQLLMSYNTCVQPLMPLMFVH